MVSLKGVSILLNVNTKLCSFCADTQDGAEDYVWCFITAAAFSSAESFNGSTNCRAEYLRVFCSHLTLGEIKHKDRPTRLQQPCLLCGDNMAANFNLITPSSVHRVTRKLQISSSLRAASAIYFLKALAFFRDSGECAFPGTIFNRAPPGVAGEWLSQQLHWQLFSKVHLIYLI